MPEHHLVSGNRPTLPDAQTVLHHHQHSNNCASCSIPLLYKDQDVWRGRKCFTGCIPKPVPWILKLRGKALKGDLDIETTAFILWGA